MIINGKNMTTVIYSNCRQLKFVTDVVHVFLYTLRVKANRYEQ